MATKKQKDEFDNCQEVLCGLARKLVGDGKTPNVFFVTNQLTGKVIALFVGQDAENEAISFADSSPEPIMVEDRLTGVVHDNPAGERYQDECAAAEQDETD